MHVLSVDAKKERAGLRYWMQRVLQESRNAGREASSEAVHDLRVSLRRCRSIASAMAGVDPDPNWNDMRRASRKVFRRLGALRDLQVLQEWTGKLADENDPVRQSLLEQFSLREPDLKAEVARALEAFDRRQWMLWSRSLSERSKRLAPDGLVAQHVALERWEEARAMHRRALRNRSAPSWHSLRIAAKRFRYTVENLLPEKHAEWGEDLKRIQDLLGDVHDLDVLAATLPEAGPVYDVAAADRWHAAIERERTARLDEYRARMAGRDSLWSVWRSGLPTGERLQAAALAKLTLWASALDPDTAHSRQVARLALELFDGLAGAGFNGPLNHPRSRVLLHAAALLHNVGYSETTRGQHKAAYRLISSLDSPLGWTAEELERVAILARYHCGGEPREKHKPFAALDASARTMVRTLAGILRIGDALDESHDGAVRHIEVRSHAEYLLIRASGWVENQANAATIGGRKHLLESALGQPIIVRSGPSRDAALMPRAVPRGAVAD